MEQDNRGEQGNQATSKLAIGILYENNIIALQEQVNQLQISMNYHCKVFQNKFERVEQKLFCDDMRPATDICFDHGSEKDCIKKDILAVRTTRSYVMELCASISLPGIKYLAESEQPKLHKWLWGFLHIVALIISASYIRNAYHHWQRSPIVLSINNSVTRVDEIPFPSVTVCEPLEYNPASNFQVIESCLKGTSWMCSDKELRELEIAIAAFPFTFFIEKSEIIRKVLPIFNHDTTFTGIEYLRFLSEVKLDKNHGLLFNFPNSNRKVPTEQYLSLKYFAWCQTFNEIRDGPRYLENTLKYELNIVHERLSDVGSACNWTPETMLTSECRNSSGLLYTKDFARGTLFYIGDNTSEVFPNDPVVFIGSPTEYTKVPQRQWGPTGKEIPRGKILEIFLSPKLVTAGSDLSDLHILNRGCAFSNEIKLSLFKLYSRNNCLYECQVNCALRRCGCIPYYIPVFNSSVRICGLLKYIECQNTTNILDYGLCGCNCPQDCVSLAYDVDTEFEERETSDIVREFTIMYKDEYFFTSFRYSVTNSFEFIAYSLGMLGVFNGASLMLVWELLYWFTIRLWATIGRAFGRSGVV